MNLLRAMSPAEWADLQAHSEFRPGPPSYQGKWLAESLDDAIAWGQRLHQNSADGFVVVEVDVPQAAATTFVDWLFSTGSVRHGLLPLMNLNP